MSEHAKYVFERQIGQSYNVNLLVHEKENINNKWIAKVSKKLAPWASFKDLDERATLASRLAKIANVSLPDFKLEKTSTIEGFNFDDILDRINNNVFLTKFKQSDLRNYLINSKFENIKNIKEIYNSFVFNLWIGSYDKKTEDYLINNENEIVSTDYQLSGPGFISDPEASIGGWVAKYYLNIPSHTGWCIEGAIKDQKTPIITNIRSEEPKINNFDEYITKIEKIIDLDVEKSMEGLNFFGESHININEQYKKFLLNRRFKIRKAVNEWIDAGYPNEIDQKKEHEERKLKYYKSLL